MSTSAYIDPQTGVLVIPCDPLIAAAALAKAEAMVRRWPTFVLETYARDLARFASVIESWHPATIGALLAQARHEEKWVDPDIWEPLWADVAAVASGALERRQIAREGHDLDEEEDANPDRRCRRGS
jgi:hypothetical protein